MTSISDQREDPAYLAQQEQLAQDNAAREEQKATITAMEDGSAKYVAMVDYVNAQPVQATNSDNSTQEDYYDPQFSPLIGQYEATAKADAAANGEGWIQAVEEYNAGKALSNAAYQPLLTQLNDYYGEGQAAVGNLKSEYAQQALKQWEVDTAPSPLDETMDTVAKVAAIAAAVYLGGAAMGAWGGGTATAGTAAGVAETGMAAMSGSTPVMAAGYAAPEIATAAVTGGTTAAGAAGFSGPLAGYSTSLGATGGKIVGTNGFIGSTASWSGSMAGIVDGALNSAIMNVGNNALVNLAKGDPLFDNAGTAALGGAVYGGVNAAIPNLSTGSLSSQVLNSAVHGSVPAAASALVTGGDAGMAALSGGLIGAGKPLIAAGVDEIIDDPKSKELNDAVTSIAQSGYSGGVSAAVKGGDTINGIVTGALGGLGYSLYDETGKAIGTMIGNIYYPSGTEPLLDPSLTLSKATDTPAVVDVSKTRTKGYQPLGGGIFTPS